MNNVINFVGKVVTGKTKEEALAKSNLDLKKEVTKTVENWKAENPNATQKEERDFLVDLLEKTTKLEEGAGLYITKTLAVANKKSRSYAFEKIAGKGARKYKSAYQIIGDTTKTVYAEVTGSKADAMNKARELYSDGLTEDVSCNLIKVVVEGEPTAFKAKYSPTKGTQEGVYYVFGIEKV